MRALYMITTTAGQVRYAGNGITTTFSVTFQFFESSTLRVRTAIGTAVTELRLGTDYEVTGGNGSTGSVTLNIAPETGTNVIIDLATPFLQETIDLSPNGPLPAEDVEQGFDRIVTMVKQIGTELATVPRMDVTFDPTDPPITIPVPVPGKYVIGNSTSTGFELANAPQGSTDSPIAVTVDTIAALKAYPDRPTFIQVLGYATPLDGGDGTFYWVAGDTTTTDEGRVVSPTGGTAGRWFRLAPEGWFSTAWYGAAGYSTSAAAVSAAAQHTGFQATIDAMATYCSAGRSGTLFCPGKFIKFGAEVAVNITAVSNCSYRLVGNETNILAAFDRTNGETACLRVGSKTNNQMRHIVQGFQISGSGTFSTRKDPILFYSIRAAQSEYYLRFGSSTSCNFLSASGQNLKGSLFSVSGGSAFKYRDTSGSLFRQTGSDLDRVSGTFQWGTSDVGKVVLIRTNTTFRQARILRVSSVTKAIVDNTETDSADQSVFFSSPFISSTGFTTTGSYTSGSAVVTAIPSTTGMLAGMGVHGKGIAEGTTVASVDSGTQITLSAVTTASSTADRLYVGEKTVTADGDGAFDAYDVGQPILLCYDGADPNSIVQKNWIESVTDANTIELRLPPPYSTSLIRSSGNLSVGSAVVTSVPSTTGMVAGQAVVGPGVRNGTTIASVDSATQITLSLAATAAGTTVGLLVNPCIALIATPSVGFYNEEFVGGGGAVSDLRFNLLVANAAGVGLYLSDVNTAFFTDSKITALTDEDPTASRYTQSHIWADRSVGYFKGEIQDQPFGVRTYFTKQTSPFWIDTTRVRLAQFSNYVKIGPKTSGYNGGVVVLNGFAVTGTDSDAEYPVDLVEDWFNADTNPGYFASGAGASAEHSFLVGFLSNKTYADVNGRLVTETLELADGVNVPSTIAGRATIFVSSADGDLKIKFGDGTVKTIVVDT